MKTHTNFGHWLFSWGLALGLLAHSNNGEKARGQAVAAKQVEAWSDERFERWFFEEEGNASEARQNFDRLLERKIEEIDRECRLSDEQKQKLRLTGYGDIKQIFNCFEKAKRQFNLLDNDPRKLGKLLPLILYITTKDGPFHDGSLFSKSLAHTLTQEQFAHYEIIDRKRREFEHRAYIELAVHIIEESEPLSDLQRRRLIALLNNKLKPVRNSSCFKFYIFMSRISLLPEDEVKPLLTKTQWKVWTERFSYYKDLVATWHRLGNLPKEEAEPSMGEKP